MQCDFSLLSQAPSKPPAAESDPSPQPKAVAKPQKKKPAASSGGGKGGGGKGGKGGKAGGGGKGKGGKDEAPDPPEPAISVSVYTTVRDILRSVMNIIIW